MSHENEIFFNSENSHSSPDFAVSQKYESEVKMVQKKSIQPTVLNNDSYFKNIPFSKCDIPNEKVQSVQPETKSEIAEDTHGGRNSNEELSPNKHSDDHEAQCSLKDKKAPEGNISWLQEIKKRISSYIICGLTNDNSQIFHTESAAEAKEDCDNIDTADIKTLGDALNKFDLSLEGLEDSLERVRRRKQNKTDHEIFFKNFDKDIQRMSLKFHPDKILNRGGTEEEINAAQKWQAAINAVRTALNILTNAFLEDLETHHTYGFYTNFELSSLSNENETKSHIYEVLFKISLLSEIKQRKIVAEIRKFLAESQRCVQSYFDDNESEFEKNRYSALFHLKCCIEGYEKLLTELKAVEKDCRIENQDNIGCKIREMASSNQKLLTVLRDLHKVAKTSLRGPYQFFKISKTSDEYFILPFVCYMNVMLMCGVMIKNKCSRSENSVLGNRSIDLKTLDVILTLEHLHSLVSSFIYYNHALFHDIVESNTAYKKEITQEFNEFLATYFNSILKETFKESNYIYNSENCYLSGELQKCMKMMSEFQKKKKKLSTDFENLKKEWQQMHEEYGTLTKQHEDYIGILEERK